MTGYGSDKGLSLDGEEDLGDFLAEEINKVDDLYMSFPARRVDAYLEADARLHLDFCAVVAVRRSRDCCASVQVFEGSVEISNAPAVLPLQGCVNGGSGELILLNGTVHFVAVLTTDDAGGMHFTLEQNFSNVTGVGTVSGDTYRVTDTVGLSGPGREALYVPPGSALPRTETVHSNIRFISMGSGDNLLGQISSHLTINANGDVTVDSVTFGLVCVG